MSDDATLNEFIDNSGDSTESGSATEDYQDTGDLQTLETSPIEDWKLVRLDDILSFEYGDNLPANTRQEGSIPVYGSNGQVDTHTEANVDSEGIIIGRKGSIGEGEFSDKPFWAIDTTYYISDEETDENLRFIYHLLQDMELERLNAASAIPGLNRNDAYNLNTLVPPLSEQKKIATVLHTVDQAIQKIQQIETQLQRTQDGLIQTFLNEGIGNSEIRETKTKLGQIPEHWEVATIDEIIADEEDAFTDGARYSLSSAEIHSEGDARAILLEEVGEADFRDTTPKFATQKKYEEITHRAIYQGEVVVAKMAEPVARACIVPETYDKYLLGCADVVRIVPNDEVDDRFLMHCMNSHIVWRQAVAHLRGTGRSRINLENIAELKIPKPPLSEQEQIAEILHEYDRKIENERAYQNQLQLLKHGLMQDLLSGEVRTTDADIDIPEEVAQYG